MVESGVSPLGTTSTIGAFTTGKLAHNAKLTAGTVDFEKSAGAGESGAQWLAQSTMAVSPDAPPQ